MKKRQEKILRCTVKEYIKTAEPISSQVLCERYHFNVSPATIRWDMAGLTEEGYFLQPHTSAGRVPTERAYKLFIEKFCEPRLSLKIEKKIEEIFLEKNEKEVMRELGKLMALISRNISILLFEREIFWQGLSYLLSQPEFYEPDEILEMVETFEDLYQGINKEEDIKREIKIYIGRENPFGKDENLSLILGGLEDGVVGILGPKRMDYQRNIALVKKAKELIERRV
jgi:heat-inducible transcriptional repressor